VAGDYDVSARGGHWLLCDDDDDDDDDVCCLRAGDYDVSAYELHVIAGAVKLFFRELAAPLIPTALLDRFLAAHSK